MRIKRNNFIIHAITMVKKNYKGYMMLSITAILCFSILLGYLMFTDSKAYNSYDELMGADPNIIVSHNSYHGTKSENLETVIGQLDRLSDTEYYLVNEIGIDNDRGEYLEIHFLPDYVWGMFELEMLNSMPGIVRYDINGKNEFSLKDDEIIVPKSIYNSVMMEDEDACISIEYVGQTESVKKSYKLAGYYDDSDMIKEGMFTNRVYVTASSLGSVDIRFVNFYLVIHTEQVDNVIEILQKNDMAIINVKDDQGRAITDKNNNIKTKYIIGIALFVLLSINLYSAFTNTLNDRKFEIGVKRAIGAGKKDIMAQFLVEGLFVMIINIIIAIEIIISAALIYKGIYQKLHNEIFTLVLSRYSVILFLTCTLSLSVLFSMIFAYKTTNIEVIQYLKEE